MKIIIRAKQNGKSELTRLWAEKALDEGKTVIDGRTGEARGAAVAKDITPMTKLIEQK